MATPAKTSDFGQLPIRPLGISSADLVDAVQSEIQKLLKQAGGNRAKAVKIAFGRLRGKGLLSDSDMARCDALMRILFDVDGKKCSQHEAVARLDKLYQEAVVDPEATQLGVSMVGGTYSKAQDRSVAIGGLFGMVVGAAVGFAIGCALGDCEGGAGIGLTVGLIVGGWLGGLCEAD